MSSVSFDDLLEAGLSPRTAYIYARILARVDERLAAAGTDLAGRRSTDRRSPADATQLYGAMEAVNNFGVVYEGDVREVTAAVCADFPYVPLCQSG